MKFIAHFELDEQNLDWEFTANSWQQAERLAVLKQIATTLPLRRLERID